MWFLNRYAHPGTAGTRRYEYSTAPSITPGTLRKLYTGLWAKQTDRCWSHHRSSWLHRDSAADEPTRTCGRWDRRRKRLLHQKSSGKIHAGGSWCAFRRGKVLCFVFVCFLFPPLGLSCQFRTGLGVNFLSLIWMIFSPEFITSSVDAGECVVFYRWTKW